MSKMSQYFYELDLKKQESGYPEDYPEDSQEWSDEYEKETLNQRIEDGETE